MLVRDASFPCGSSRQRKILEESIDINNPIGSITRLLVEVQIYQHPSSLIKDWALGNNMISHVIQTISIGSDIFYYYMRSKSDYL